MTGTNTTSARAARPSSLRKRAAILDAAEGVFLRDGYVGASMDEVTASAGVSKQTVYNHFGTKEDLFVALVESMASVAGDAVHALDVALPDAEDLAEFLEEYATRQLTVVLTPRLLRLRRLVIGEVERFPGLARVFWDAGPQRAIDSMTALFVRLERDGLIRTSDPARAASYFNWIVMSGPLNEAMLLGDDAVPDPAALRRHAREAVRIFLAAHARLA